MRTTVASSVVPPLGPSRFGPEYWSLVDQCAREPAAECTALEYLREPSKAWQARLDLLRQAKSSIVCTTYLLEPDERGVAFVDGLIAARQRGVKVCLAIDFLAQAAISQKHSSEARAELQRRFEALAAAGGVVAWYATPQEQLRRLGSGMHFKSLIADAKTAIIGGRNVGEWYFGEWSDFDMQVEGPIVGSIARAAHKLLERSELARWGQAGFDQRSAYASLCGELNQELIAKDREVNAAVAARKAAGERVGPSFHLVCWDPLYDGGEALPLKNRVTTALTETFERAKTEILVTSNFVNGPKEITSALVKASLRGAHVLLVTSGEDACKLSTLPYLNAKANYSELVAAGVEIYETAAQEHGKMYSIDNEVGAFGSYNLEKPADTRLVEGLMFTDDAGVVANLRDNILATASQAKKFVPRKEKVGFGRWLKRLFAKLLEPFL